MLQTGLGRALLAAFGLSLSALLFHGEIGQALISRGDDMLVRNAYRSAAASYWRALWLDPGSGTAIDRLAFIALQQRSPRTLRDVAALASGYLGTHPADKTVLFDRGLCYLKLRDYRHAYRDFLGSAQLSGDPQQYAFAGWAARRAGSVHKAVSAWRRALLMKQGYRPALVALSELKQ